MTRADRLLLLGFALANAALYSSLLPLWEGFDEPFHYGYVQYLAAARRLPVLGQTDISREVWQSMLACPASHVVQRTRPELQTFDRYFALGPEARAQERARLEAIPPYDAAGSAQSNYEAHQAPLAYLLLAVPDRLLSRLPIPTRILWLRILGAAACALLTYLAAGRLFRALELPAPLDFLGLFSIFACQMYWATAAHVANDWLAVPLSIWFFAALADFARQPRLRNTVLLAVAVSLGLLAKAYFLPLAGVALCAVAFRHRRGLPAFAAVVAVLAGPWYARNLALYQSLTATVESASGIGPRQVIAALGRVPWGHSIPYMLRGALWTGNNSFVSFSSTTLNCVLALLAAGVVAYAVHAFRRPAASAAERAVLGAMAVYGCAIVYVTGSEFLFRQGASAGASPWYLEVLLAPALAVSFLGVARAPRFGACVAIATVLLWTYICLATYLVKLIPLYGGYPKGRTTLRDVWDWYLSHHGEMTGMLSTISLAPPAVLYVETGAVCVLAAVLAARLLRSIAAAR